MFLYCMGVYIIVLVGGTYLESPSLYGDARYRIRRSVQSNKVFIPFTGRSYISRLGAGGLTV
jgi:hypothetical protein